MNTITKKLNISNLSSVTNSIGSKYLLKNFVRFETNHMRIAGTGNPYETNIRRRRHVPDINIPNFEKQECLKWAKWTMFRDAGRRVCNSKYWQYRMNLQNISSSRTLPTAIRDLALEERLATPRRSSVNKVANRCALTSRFSGINHQFRLSRNVWRDQADHGLIAGYNRAMWG